MFVGSAVPALEPFHTPISESDESHQRLCAFYDVLESDSAAWSKSSNLHFGFFRRGMNPLKLETMLEQMTLEVLSRLKMEPIKGDCIIDLGCGLGASIRTAAFRYPEKTFAGVTIVPGQVKQGNKLHEQAGLENRVVSILADYSELPFEERSFDYAYAIESAMHAAGTSKSSLIREAARILKPGGRFVMAEPFLKNESKPLGVIGSGVIKTMCRCWAADQMAQVEHFASALEEEGFHEISLEDISWRVAPSVAHVPFAILRLFCKSFLRQKKLQTQSWNNLLACILAIPVSLYRSKVSYYLVSATRL